jgi:hypothetical protein
VLQRCGAWAHVRQRGPLWLSENRARPFRPAQSPNSVPMMSMLPTVPAFSSGCSPPGSCSDSIDVQACLPLPVYMIHCVITVPAAPDISDMSHCTLSGRLRNFENNNLSQPADASVHACDGVNPFISHAHCCTSLPHTRAISVTLFTRLQT